MTKLDYGVDIIRYKQGRRVLIKFPNVSEMFILTRQCSLCSLCRPNACTASFSRVY
jgi:hypothetical protein